LKNCIDIVGINYKNFKYNFNQPKNELFSLVDSNKTQQILINILDNASKYSNNSNIVDISLYNKGDFNVFGIKNYGSYIEKKEISHIFEKFYRTDSYIHSSTQGSGLGLYIANNLAKKMQGYIEVKSDKDKLETEFLIYLPVYEVEKITKCIKQES
jgi:signal transduction histidine kinase